MNDPTASQAERELAYMVLKAIRTGNMIDKHPSFAAGAAAGAELSGEGSLKTL